MHNRGLMEPGAARAVINACAGGHSWLMEHAMLCKDAAAAVQGLQLVRTEALFTFAPAQK